MHIIYFHKMVIPGPKAHTIQILNTARALAERGVRVDIYVLTLKNHTDNVYHYYGISPHECLRLRQVPKLYGRFNRWRGIGFALYCFFVLKRYRREKSVVIVRDERLTLLLLRLSFLLNFKVIPEIHVLRSMKLEEEARNGSDAKIQQNIHRRSEGFRKLEEKIFTKAHGIICITHNLQKLIFERYEPCCKILVAHDGTVLYEPKNPEEFSFDVLYAGQLYERKNPDIIIKAISLLDHVRCGIIGGTECSDLNRLKKAAKDYGVEDRVSFFGMIPHSKVLELLPRAKVLALPLTDTVGYRYFTSPMKLFEYMNSGRPIVAADLPSIREILSHEKNALLFPPTDHKKLAELIMRLIETPELSERLGRAARQKVQNFSWDRRAEEIIEFLKTPPAS